MNIIITLLIIIAVVVLLLLVTAVFLKKEYVIERDVIISRPVAVVFSYIKYLKNQDHYSKWVMMDPEMKKHFKGVDGTPGFVYAWDGNKKAGKGEQEIMFISEGEAVGIEIRFVKPFENTATAVMRTEPMNLNQTKVKWVMKGKSPYPMNLMHVLLAGVLGRDMQTSLDLLKHNLETSEKTKANLTL